MHGFWVASLQVWPRWALTVIRFVEKYFTCVKDPKNSGQSLVAALQSRPPLTLTINTIRDYVSMYMQLFTPLYVTSHHYDICTFEGTKVPSKVSFWVAASVYQILLLTNNGVRRLSVLWKTTVQRDVLIVALGVHVVAVLTRTPLVNEETTPRRFWRRGSGRRS